MTPPIRALTWNIHGAIGGDGRADLPRVLGHLARLAPDVAALQEIEGRGMPEDPFPILQQALGGHCCIAGTLGGEGGHYGHLLASRWPLANTRLHDLSVDGREPRTAITATVAAPTGPLHILAVHLGLGLRERRLQAERLAAILATLPAPALVLGDINEWQWRGPVHRALRQFCAPARQQRSFPARFPLLPLDVILARPPLRIIRNWADRAAAAASDHLPVMAELTMPSA